MSEKDEALEWMSNGEVGISSKAIVYAALGMKPNDSWIGNYPVDPDDFRRCHTMLGLIPWARRGIDVLAEQCPVWRGMSDKWDEMTALYLAESPSGGYPQLYDTMRQIINDAEVKR